MSLSDRLASSLFLTAAVAITICLFVTAPAFGPPLKDCHGPLGTHYVAIASEGGAIVDDSKACCTQMQCCLILPASQRATLPNLPFTSPRTSVQCERPLLLVVAIDPPPRFRAL